MNNEYVRWKKFTGIKSDGKINERSSDIPMKPIYGTDHYVYDPDGGPKFTKVNPVTGMEWRAPVTPKISPLDKEGDPSKAELYSFHMDDTYEQLKNPLEDSDYEEDK